jgi:hypothetical protein
MSRSRLGGAELYVNKLSFTSAVDVIRDSSLRGDGRSFTRTP